MDGESVKRGLGQRAHGRHIEAVRAQAMMKWAIKRAFKERERHLGMDQRELRSSASWRRRMQLALICHLLAAKLRLRLGYQARDPITLA